MTLTEPPGERPGGRVHILRTVQEGSLGRWCAGCAPYIRNSTTKVASQVAGAVERGAGERAIARGIWAKA